MFSSYQNKKKKTNVRVLSSCVAFLVFASIPELSFAHGRYGWGSCGRSHYRMYPRWHDSYWDTCGGYRSCGSRRRYGDAIGIFGDIVQAGMNSLARQQRRSVAIVDHKETRYSIEDHGRNGLLLTMEIPDLTAREMDLEIIRENGVNTLVVSDKPGFRRRGHGTVQRFLQSFVINDSTIDLDGVTARVTSEILTISLPRKVKKYRKRMVLPVKKYGSFDRDPGNGDKIVVLDSKSGSNFGAKERLTRQSVTVEETQGKTFDESNSIESDERAQKYDDDLYISEAEDVW